MPDVLTIPPSGASRAEIRRIVEVLLGGGLAALPDETGYVLCGSPLEGNAIERLLEVCPTDQTGLSCLDGEAAEDLAPPDAWTPAAARLARRCWPGPLVLEFPADPSASLWGEWPEPARRWLTTTGRVRLSCSAHPIWRELLRELPWPLAAAVATHAQPTQRFESIADVQQRCGTDVSLLVDAGPPRYQDRATVMRIAAGHCELTEEGIIGRWTVTQLASEIVLFVCTGNTCRSPMAEALFRKMLAERLHCAEEDLPERGYLVLSAGLATTPGMPASEHAAALMREVGIDLTGHQSQPATAELLNVADHIITMTSSHRESIGARFPEILPRVRLLSPHGQDISDPFGGGREDYVRCREEIQTCLRRLLDHLLAPSSPREEFIR